MNLIKPNIKDKRYCQTSFKPKFNLNNQLDIKHLMNCFQSLASKQIEELGLGNSFEEENSCLYVVLRYKGYFLKQLNDKDEYTMITFPIINSIVQLNRYAYILDNQGDVVFYLISVWVLIDKNTRKIKPCKKFNQELIQTIPEVNNLKPITEEKLQNFPIDDYTFNIYDHYQVKDKDIDGNGHMNNTIYFELVKPKKRNIHSFEINYENECFLNDDISLYFSENENSEIYKGMKGNLISFKVKYFFS